MQTYLIPWLKAAGVLAPVILFAATAARLLCPRRDVLLRAVVGILLAFGLVVAVGGLLGMSGWLSYTGYLIALWWVALILGLIVVDPLRMRRDTDEKVRPLPSAPWPVIALAMCSWTLLAGSLAARLVQPTVEYDELTYHLHFPAQWLNAGRIFLIDVPFGGAAPAYAPANGELWLTWLMAPFRGWAGPLGSFKLCGVDALARVGQFPFFVLAVLSLLVMGRELGARTGAMYLPGALLSFSPWVLREAATAGVDLVMAGCLLAALALAMVYRRDGRRAIAASCGLALGLAVGAKAVVLAYSIVVVPAVLICLLSRRDAKAVGAWLGAVVVFGSPWYLRNLIVAGNPLFPIQFLFFRGAFVRRALDASPFHVPDFASALAVSAQAIGFWLVPLGVGGLITALVLARKNRAWLGVAWIAPAAVVWHFLSVPYSSQDRFLMWAVALSLLPFGCWPMSRRGQFALLLLLPSLFLTLWGPGRGFRVGALPVSGRGTFLHDGWWIALLVLAFVAVAWFFARRLKASPAWRATMVFCAGIVPALVIAQPRSGVFVETGLHAITNFPFRGYVEVWKRHPSVVAYAGRNVPYYLAGRDGRTRVLSMNTDGQTSMLLHDYVNDLALVGKLDQSQEEADWRGHHPDFAHWRNALLENDVQLLFLEPLPAMTKTYMFHDAEGFSIERQWAREHPETFALLNADAAYELYELRLR